VTATTSKSEKVARAVTHFGDNRLEWQRIKSFAVLLGPSRQMQKHYLEMGHDTSRALDSRRAAVIF
jgi:hypothetical protein